MCALIVAAVDDDVVVVVGMVGQSVSCIKAILWKGKIDVHVEVDVYEESIL